MASSASANRPSTRASSERWIRMCHRTEGSGTAAAAVAARSRASSPPDGIGLPDRLETLLEERDQPGISPGPSPDGSTTVAKRRPGQAVAHAVPTSHVGCAVEGFSELAMEPCPRQGLTQSKEQVAA